MAKDIGQELDEILATHHAHRKEAGQKAAANRADAEAFNQAAAACMRDVVAPALNEMERALAERSVAAKVVADGQAALIYVPKPSSSGDPRLGARVATYGVGDLPYLRIVPEPHSRRIRFEHGSGSSPGRGVGDAPPAEVTPDVVKAKVMTLVRELYGSR